MIDESNNTHIISSLSIVKAHRNKRTQTLIMLWSVPFLIVVLTFIFIVKTTLFFEPAAAVKLLSCLLIITCFFIWLYMRIGKSQYRHYSYKKELLRCSSDELATIYRLLEKRKIKLITVIPTHVFILYPLCLQAIPINQIVWINHGATYMRIQGITSYIQILTKDKKLISLRSKSNKIDLHQIIKLVRMYRPHLLFTDSGEINAVDLLAMKRGRNNELQKHLDLLNSDFEKMVRLSDGKEAIETLP